MRLHAAAVRDGVELDADSGGLFQQLVGLVEILAKVIDEALDVVETGFARFAEREEDIFLLAPYGVGGDADAVAGLPGRPQRGGAS